MNTKITGKPRKAAINKAVAEAVASGNPDAGELIQHLAQEGVEVTLEVIERRIVKQLHQHDRETLPRVYADACTIGSTVGIGVYCDSPEIKIKRETEAKTNNAAECIAILDAIDAGKKAGLDRFIVCSDSQLAVCWVNGDYARKSETAQYYAPKIEQSLAQANAELIWVPGARNPADRLSRLAVGYDPDLPLMERIRRTPTDRIPFGDFAKLKSGRDDYTNMRLPKLEEAVPESDLHTARNAFEKDADVARCLRWMLRGLPPDKAIRKVETDLEISDRIRERRRAEREEEWGDWL